MDPAIQQMPRGNWQGATPFWASKYDPRFSYCLYVPGELGPDTRIFVCVHGSFRVPESYRDHLWRFAEETKCVLLCPLFPCGVHAPDDTSSYKRVYTPEIRYDLVLLSMVDEVAERLSIDGSRFALAGFSGGGQFAHRFLFGHAGRLLGVSIGAPGTVTQLDFTLPWWRGVDGLEVMVGALDLAAMRQVPVQMIVGSQDTKVQGTVSQPGSPLYMEGINDTGTGRVEKLCTLKASFDAHDIPSELVIVPGVKHEGFAVLEPVKSFIRGVLGDRSQAGRAAE